LAGGFEHGLALCVVDALAGEDGSNGSGGARDGGHNSICSSHFGVQTNGIRGAGKGQTRRAGAVLAPVGFSTPAIVESSFVGIRHRRCAMRVRILLQLTDDDGSAGAAEEIATFAKATERPEDLGLY
jgi:hypothetical protein